MTQQEWWNSLNDEEKQSWVQALREHDWKRFGVGGPQLDPDFWEGYPWFNMYHDREEREN